jgi:hypothetical protein
VKKVLASLVVLLVAGAFLAGWWPQRERLARAQAETSQWQQQLATVRVQLAQAEARNRLGRILGQLLALQDAVVAANYGEARTLSSPFFDLVREEAGRATDGAIRTSLEAILMRRDAVTAGLARGEASVRDELAPIGRELRRTLGYPLPSLAPPKAVAAESVP